MVDDNINFRGDSDDAVAAASQLTSSLLKLQGAMSATASVASKFSKEGTLLNQNINKMSTSFKDGATQSFRFNEAGKVTAVTIRQNTKIAKNFRKRIDDLNLSFKSLARIMLIQIVRNAFFRFAQAVRQSIDAAAEFQVRISEIRTISQDNQLSTLRWASELKKLTEAFGIPILDQAEAAYQTLSNQIAKGVEVTEFLAVANRFAIAAVTDASTAVNLLSSVIKSFNLEAADAERVAAVLFKTIELGRVRAEDMANTFGRLGPIAFELGLSLEELSAIIDTITIRGIRFNEASTQIRGIFIKLLKPTTAMKELFADIGVESGEAAIKTFGFGGFLEILAKRTQGSTTELSKLINRVRGLTGAIIATGSGLETFKEDLIAAENAQKSFNKAVEIGFESTGKAFQIEVERIKVFFQEDLGRQALQIIFDISKNFGGLSVIIKGLTKALIAMVPVIGAVTAAFLLLSLSNPFTAIIVASAALITTLSIVTEKIKQEEERQKKIVENIAKARIQIFEDEANARIGLVQETLKDQLRKERRLTADLIAEQRSRNKEQKKGFDDLGRAFKDSISNIRDSLRDQTKAAESEFKRLIGIAEDATKDIRDTIRGLGEELFDIDVAKFDVRDQIKAIGQQILVLRKEQQAIALDANKEEFDAIRKRTIELFRQRAKLRQDSDKADRESRQKFIELEAQGLKVAFDITKSVVDRRNKLLEIIQEQRNLQFINLQEVDIRQQLEDFRRKELDLLLILKKAAEDKALVEQQAIKDRIALEFEFKLLSNELLKFDLTKVLEGRDPQRIKQLIDDRINRTKDLIDFIKKEGFERVNTARIVKRVQEEERRANERIRNIESRAREKEIEDINKQIVKNAKLVLGAIGESEIQLGFALDRVRVKGRQVIDDVTRQFQKIAFKRRLREELEEPFERFTKVADAFKAVPTIKGFKAIEQELIDIATSLRNEVNPNIKGAGDEVFGLVQQFQNIGPITGAEAIIRDLNIQLKTLEELEKNAGVEAAKFIKAMKNNENATDLFNKSLSGRGRLIQSLKEAKAALIALREAPLPVPTPIQEAQGGLVKQFAHGGQAHGSDRIPALLSPGEFVVNAAASRKFFSQLTAINSSVQPMAGGGPITNVTGDFNINLTSTGNEQVDVVRIGKLLRREIRRGRIKL